MHSLAPHPNKCSLRPFAAGAALLAAVGCAGADEADDAPAFMPGPATVGGAANLPPPAAAGSTTAPAPGVAAPGSAAPGSAAPGSAAPGSAAPGSAAPGGAAAPGAGAEGANGSVPLAPAGTGGASSSGGDGSGMNAAAGGATANGAGGAPTGVGAAGPGRVGLELCPAGPFESPLANAATPQLLASVGADNFFIFEGPVWTGDALLLSEIDSEDNSQIDRFVPNVGLERGAFPDSGSNGLALDATGSLLLAAHDVGGISQLALATGVITRGAQRRNGMPFNSPNDLVVRGDGNIYFTDPDFQAPNGRTQDGTHVYRIAPPLGAGEISVVDASMSNPNGITLSPDGNTLYASAAGVLREYALDAAGAATPVGDLTNQIGTPDGMTVDCAGNIYAVRNDASSILVLSPEGEMLGTIGGPDVFAQAPTNVAFGGANRTTLFITTFSQADRGGLYSVELAVPGFPY